MPRRRQAHPLPTSYVILTGVWTLLLIGAALDSYFVLDGPLRPNFMGRETRTAEVLQSEVRERRSGSKRYYEPRVKYRYDIAPGVEHSDDRIQRGPLHFDTREEAQAWLQDYPVGAQIEICFRPGRPRSPVIMDGREGAVLHAAISVPLALLAFLGLRWQLRRNSYAYLEGRPRPIFARRPRPMRAAEPGEVHPGKANYRRSAGARIRPAQGYRQLPRGGP